MEHMPGLIKEENQMSLPPGFRFHPTDEELITHYLCKKVTDSSFSATAIGDVDLNKCEPWDLPWKAKMGEKEWYFFCVRDRKYPTGLRTNRATKAGYWKATGKDKEIFRGRTLVGMKKTLVFYEGRAPKGEKSNWVMHEFRLDGKFTLQTLPSSAQSEWVICRVFQKIHVGGKKTQFSGLVKVNSFENKFNPSFLPPLMDSTPYYFSNKTKSPEESPNQHVPCFSTTTTTMNFQRDPEIGCFNNNNNNNNPVYPRSNLSTNSPYPVPENWQFQGSLQEQSYLRALVENQVAQSFKAERDMVMSVSQETGVSNEVNTEISSVMSSIEMGRRPFEDHEAPSAAPGELGCLWQY